MAEDRKRGFNVLLDWMQDGWNLPNQAIGYGLGYLGHGIGQITSRLGNGERPWIERDHERGITNFYNSPLTPRGALTIGGATMYDAYPETDPGWQAYQRRKGHSVRDHEAAHLPQARFLGPFYLPSNLAGGIASILFDRGHEDWPWHGPSNWNERGPQQKFPRPWSDNTGGER